MRIKFRVWDGTKFWHDVAIYDNSPYVWNYEETSLVPLFNQEQIDLYGKPIIQQFTGFNAKNGEIFVGDIIFEDGGKFNLEVKQLDSGLFVADSNKGYVDLVINIASKTKIIGNICQNPELLK